MTPASTCFSDLDVACQQKIFSHLTAAEAARSMLVDRYWNETLRDELLWKALGEEDWYLTTPCTFTGAPLASYRLAYMDWQQQLGMYSGRDRLPQRAARVWGTIRRWFAHNIPDIANTLRPCMSEAELDEQGWPGMLLPPALRIHYRFCGGQAWEDVQGPVPTEVLDDDDGVTGLPVSVWGLFGGCLILGRASPFMGATFMPLSETYQLLTCMEGTVIDIHPFSSLGWGNMAYAVHLPTGRIQIVREGGTPLFVTPEGRGMMEWMEDFAAKLATGAFRGIYVKPVYYPTVDPPPFEVQEDDAGCSAGDIRCLSRFPQTVEAGMLEEVTQGVRVRMSPALTPTCYKETDRVEMLYAYKRSFCLLPEEQQQESWPASSPPFRPRSQVQLGSHCFWVEVPLSVQYSYNFLGMNYPVLKAGGPEKSMSSFLLAGPQQSKWPWAIVGGRCSFVEGSVASPTGPTFEVQCPSLELCLSKTAWTCYEGTSTCIPQRAGRTS